MRSISNHSLPVLIALILACVWLNPSARAALHFQTLKAFPSPDPIAQITAIQSKNGVFYGTSMLGGSNRSGEVFQIDLDGSNYRVLHSFGVLPGDGSYPFAPLLAGSDGALYGTTTSGGTNENQGGTVFRLNRDGGDYSVLHSFGAVGDGEYPPQGLGWANPMAAPIEGSDGALYGTTLWGGASTNSAGVLFKLKRDGTGYQVLHSFGDGPDGRNPSARLLEANDGALYGTTVYGGAKDSGTVFRLDKDGANYRVIYDFGPPNGGMIGALVEGDHGALFGITQWGGDYRTDFASGLGTLFTLNKDGTAFRVLHSFGEAMDVRYPALNLMKRSDGMLYGTGGGGANGWGAVYRISQDGTSYRVLYNIRGSDHVSGLVNLTEATDGTLFGTSLDSGLLFKLNRDGADPLLVYSAPLPPVTEGAQPNTLLEGDDGCFYGTTARGGERDEGTAFKLNRDGSGFSVIYSFSGGPPKSLIQAKDGGLYGTLINGGSNGWGAVFKVNRDGNGYTTLHSFGDPGDGQTPFSLIQGSDRALYGTTSRGGAFLDQNGLGWGTVFRLGIDGGGYRVLHSFGDGKDGKSPAGALVEGKDGALYGVTFRGGEFPVCCVDSERGTVFKLNKDGSDYRVLFNFGPDTSGFWPDAGLLQASDGALYGATSFPGSVFKLNTDGGGFENLQTLGYVGEIGSFHSALVEGPDELLYGTARWPEARWGGVFRVAKDGSAYRLLHRFAHRTDGSFPNAGLVLGSDGAFYSTTDPDGSGGGSVYKLWPPETPDMMGVVAAGNHAQVSFAGEKGARYQILRSTDLISWSLVETITMPASGVYSHTDNAVLAPLVYYRAAWLP